MVAPTPSSTTPNPQQKRIGYGGVSPKLRAPALHGQEVVSVPKSGGGTPGQAFPAFVYR